MVDLSNVLKNTHSVQVEAHWAPITDAKYNLHQLTQEQFDRLKTRWPEPVNMTYHQVLDLFDFKPAVPLQNYRTEDFQVFLPDSRLNVGDVWDLEGEGILPFLRQFHPGATMDFRVYRRKRDTHVSKGKKGAKACLRALSPKYADIVFRIHALFILNPYSEARFMPAQFAGNLVINRENGNVNTFSLSVPTRNSNVDINAFGVADIGFVPRMELSALPTTPIDEITWKTTITEHEARAKLKSAFYKFAKIRWTPVEKAVELAKAKNQPIHATVLFGALDDESC